MEKFDRICSSIQIWDNETSYRWPKKNQTLTKTLTLCARVEF